MTADKGTKLSREHSNRTPATPDGPTAVDMENSSPASASTIPSLSDRASRLTISDKHPDVEEHHEHEEEVPPPYSDQLGRISGDSEHVGTNAAVAQDGRINITIDQHTKRLSALLAPTLTPRHEEEPPPPYIPPSLGGSPDQEPPPSMNVVIHVVGSRGDVQPFVALGKVLKETYGHRVRLATHPTFKQFVEENDLEFFSITGDPAELMAFMVKNPGLMPGFDAIRNGDIGARRKGIQDMIRGCWRSCFEAGDGTGVAVTDETVAEWMKTGNPAAMSPEAAAAAASTPFVADCIIANPPSFAHIHCAERLGIPLHIMFTMPWSPTQAFPHPLANIQSSNADASMTNYITYALVDMLTWQGLGDIINQFRVHTLSLEPVSLFWAPAILNRLKVPHTYCWSPALIPKPADWAPYISISGFFFLSLASNYTPQPELKEFLDAGPPPVYIGFGSIVVDDPNAMTKMIFEAVEKTGQRALVSKGWGGIGADDLGKPEGVYMLGNVPHDWLFHRVSSVVHHGGAGTTAAGIACGKPTVIVPFFGDQPFWGAMVAKAGAGPLPIPYKDLTADKLADAINFAIKHSSQERAKELAQKISREDGNQKGAQTFHQMLDVDKLRCSIIPSKPAVWRVKRTQIRLSALAAYALASQNVISFDDLKLYRPKEWEGDMGPPDPVTGATVAMVGTVGTALGGVADLPIETLKALKIHPDSSKRKAKSLKKAGEVAKSQSTGAPASSSALSDASGTMLPNTQPSGIENIAGAMEMSADSHSTTTAPTDDTSSVADTILTTTSGSTRLESTPSATSMDSGSTRTAQSPDTPSKPKSEGSLNVPGADDDRGRNSSMVDALHQLSDNSRPHSRSGGCSPRRPSSSQRSQSGRKSSFNFTPHASQYAPDPLDTVYGTGKGISKIVGAGLKSPLDFTMAITKGFHNVPRLYGEEPRQVDRVTGVQSGLRTAGKEFGMGLFDGITGLFTQPVTGARKEGASGFLKGVGRGIAGIVVKPSAAAYALPAYAMMGVYKEIQKRLGENVGSYIIAARVAQGYGEWLSTEETKRRDIVHKWAECLSEVKGRRGFGKKKEQGGMPAIKEFVEKRKEQRRAKHIKDKEGPAYEAAVHALSTSQVENTSAQTQSREQLAPESDHDDAELEEAIRLSLKVDESEAHDDSDAELKEAVAKSLEQMKRVDEDHEEEQMRKAITESMKHHAQQVQPESSRHGQHEAHDDELQRAMEESKKHGDEEERRRKHEEDLVLEYVRKQSLAEEEWRRRAKTD